MENPRNKRRNQVEILARTLMIGGIVLFLVGGGICLSAKLGLPLGRLPGDIRIERDGFFPPNSACRWDACPGTFESSARDFRYTCQSRVRFWPRWC